MKITTEQLLTLLNIKGVGKTTVFDIYNSFDLEDHLSNDDFFHYILQLHAQFGFKRFRDVDLLSLREANFFAKRIVEESNSNNVQILSYFDPDFPKMLRTIKKPPLILSVKGNYKVLNDLIGVAIIGTREPTESGIKVGNKIGRKAGMLGLNVISGLAKGCDAAAHEGCINGNGFTTAILAHGLQMVYPKENIKLADRIVASGGCLISEYIWNTKPMNNYFVERDRLQSGLSKATIVIESDIKGGTMYAVKDTLDSGKTLGAIKFRSEETVNPKCRGNEILITEGKAFPITSDNYEEFLRKIKTNTSN